MRPFRPVRTPSMHTIRDNRERRLLVYHSPKGKCVISVESPGNTEVVDERTPLTSQNGGCGGKPRENDSGGGTELRLTFIAILVCSFLSAFDFTVLAAIFPLM